MMAAPGGVQEHADRLVEILLRNKAAEGNDLKYAFAHLSDHLEHCAVLFSKGLIEITPPFLPSMALNVFDRNIRRVYLSATLKHKTDFVRAFGRLPEIAIEPRNDAGNGERLILFGREGVATSHRRVYTPLRTATK